MTILTDKELKAINELDRMQPLSPFVPQLSGNPSRGLSSHGYDICLDGEWYISKRYHNYNLKPLVIDPVSNHRGSQVELAFEFVQQDSIVIQPHEFVLAASQELFDMPNDVCAEVKDKSSLARLGLQVFNTIIEAGWRGRLTIEIYNNSANQIRLSKGMGIAQIVFHKLNCIPFTTYADRQGKYQNQGLTGPAVTLTR